jgi:hypothetical protein
MLVMCCCSVDARLKVDANVLSLGSGLCRWCVRFGLIFILNCSGQSFSARKTRATLSYFPRGAIAAGRCFAVRPTPLIYFSTSIQL